MFRKWRQVLTPLNIISTLPLLFAMLCGGYLSYRYDILLRENRDLVVHTYQVINAIDGLLIRLEDAETGQRGYIITGEASYLLPTNARPWICLTRLIMARPGGKTITETVSSGKT